MAIHTELGAGSMLSAAQRDILHLGLGLQGDARLGVSLADPVALQVSVGYAWFHRESSDAAEVLAFTAGVRLEPRVGALGRVFLDGNAGLAQTGNLQRFVFDVGVGFEFAVTRALGLGPMVRYHHLVQTEDGPPGNPDPLAQDAQWWSAGLAFTLRAPPR